jgi:hypothetical protein
MGLLKVAAVIGEKCAPIECCKLLRGASDQHPSRKLSG